MWALAYITDILVVICIYAILTMGLNLTIGYVGIFNLGHAAFFGIGAYASSLLALRLGLSFWIALPLAGILSAVTSFLLALTILRLRHEYLAIVTLGFSAILYTLLSSLTEVTGGPSGLAGIPEPELMGFRFGSGTFLLISGAVLIILVIVMLRITTSGFGRVLKAIREDEVAAVAMGRSSFKYKTMALMISAFYAGIAGSLFAHYYSFIEPDSFAVLAIVPMLAMVIIGGAGSIPGSVLGAALLVILTEVLRFVGFPGDLAAKYQLMAFACFFILVLMFRPRGILGRQGL